MGRASRSFLNFYSLFIVYQLAKGDWDMFAGNISTIIHLTQNRF
jgi:hypothetical protein